MAARGGPRLDWRPITPGDRELLPDAKALVADALCHPVVGRTLRALFRRRIPSLRFPGWRVEADPAVVSPRTVAMIFWGIYESAELRFIRSHLRTDLDVVEVGSSIGAVSSAIAQRLGPGRRLLCVEANPTLIPLLRRNVAANAPDRAVEIVNRAIDYRNDSVVFTEGALTTGGHTVGSRPDGGRTHEVPASTLEALLDAHGIGEYALVSDIEGAEAGFIGSDPAALARCQQLLIELHDAEIDGRSETVASLRDALTGRHGFRVSASHGPVYVFER